MIRISCRVDGHGPQWRVLRRPWSSAAVFFGLGMVGVVLPGIPTTPFLLLMCYFLIRVSPRLHAKALAWPVVGKPLRDWHEKQGVHYHIKVLAYLLVALLVGYTIIFGDLHVSVKAVIFVLSIVGIAVVVRLPTIHRKRGCS
ncbi:YbaN family protein [Novipirellula aureliae]|uniref:YbaN family protein n=1 Tax=Novipirellula aureliae TaxID=2527966 RepID=UPI001E534F92|nr:YbaN family protein [Novipirellula aureliae]